MLQCAGVHHLHYGTALKEGQVALMELMGLLVSAVSAALHAPSPQHLHMVKVLVSDARPVCCWSAHPARPCRC
jgi:hypothetical protein